MPSGRKLPDVPYLSEVGGYVNQETALRLLGLKSASRSWLYELVSDGKIKAAYFDERTLMYDKASLEAYVAGRPGRAGRRPGQRKRGPKPQKPKPKE